MKKENGLTLLEMVFVLVLLSALIGATVFLYVVSLKSWDELGRRSETGGELHFALERVIRDVRKANAIQIANHALRFTLNECSGACTNNSYIYYLYHASDSWTPTYNQTTYQLRRADLTGGIDGIFTYGAGDLIAPGLKPPSADTTITNTGNVVKINLVGLDSNETVRVRGFIRPRNV